jgi:hypothetical protein
MLVAGRRGLARVLRPVLDSPLLGWAPWIALSVLVGPGRFILSVLVALLLSASFIAADRRRGKRLKLLNVVDLASFVVFLAIALAVSAGTTAWLETWFGEISNLTFVVVTVASLLVRQPVTLQYTREELDPARWGEAAFLRVNYVMTIAWAGAFVIAGLAALHGDAILHNNNNLWTAWVIQIAAELAAAEFTIWYPRRVAPGARFDLETLLLPLAIYLIPVGVLSLWLDAAPTALGATFIAAGTAASLWLGAKVLTATATAGASTATG